MRCYMNIDEKKISVVKYVYIANANVNNLIKSKCHAFMLILKLKTLFSFLNNKISRTYDYPICCSNSIFCIWLVHRTNNEYKTQTKNDSSVVSNDIHICYMSLLLLFFRYHSPRNSA